MVPGNVIFATGAIDLGEQRGARVAFALRGVQVASREIV